MGKHEKKSRSRGKATKSKSKEIVKSKSEESQPESLEPKRRRSSKKTSSKEEEPPAILPYSLILQAGTYTVKLHQTYTVKDDNPLYSQIANLYPLFIEKQKKRGKQMPSNIQMSYFPSFEFVLKEQKPSEQKCSICQFEYQQIKNFEDELVRESEEDVVSLQCSHLLHRGCFFALKGEKEWVRCPVCGTIFGEMVGDQPPGSMTCTVNRLMHCEGFEDVGTTVIDYNMKSGKRGNISFPGTHRTAYLPDNEGGNQVLRLLKEAFDRKLIFTVGRSVTTGRDNQIVWNGVHHKTNTSGGAAYFGYPDETYFDRVKLQLAAKGVV